MGPEKLTSWRRPKIAVNNAYPETSPGIDSTVATLGILVFLLLIGGFLLGLWAMGNRTLREKLWPRGELPRAPELTSTLGALSIFMLCNLGLLAGFSLIRKNLGDWTLPVYAGAAQFIILFAAVFAARNSREESPGGLAALGLSKCRPAHLSSALTAYLCAIWVLAAINILNFLLYENLLGKAPPLQPIIELMQQIPAGPRIAMALIAVAGAACCEELLFRGALFGSLRRHLGFWPAALLSGMLFGAVHFSIPHFLPLTALGVVFAWLYQRTGSIWPAIFMHALQNLIVVVMTYSNMLQHFSASTG